MLRGPAVRLLSLMLLVLSLPACGVVFSAQFEGTEVFRDFELESDSEANGKFVAGSAIEVTVSVQQTYPVPIVISCGYENVDITDDERKVAFNERAITVFETTLPANPGHVPGEDEDVASEVMRFEFTEAEPGEYFIACFTVAAPENGIGRGFTLIEQ